MSLLLESGEGQLESKGSKRYARTCKVLRTNEMFVHQRNGLRSACLVSSACLINRDSTSDEHAQGTFMTAYRIVSGHLTDMVIV